MLNEQLELTGETAPYAALTVLGMMETLHNHEYDDFKKWFIDQVTVPYFVLGAHQQLLLMDQIVPLSVLEPMLKNKIANKELFGEFQEIYGKHLPMDVYNQGLYFFDSITSSQELVLNIPRKPQFITGTIILLNYLLLLLSDIIGQQISIKNCRDIMIQSLDGI